MTRQYGLFPVEASDDMLVAGQEAWVILTQERTAIDDCKHAEAVWKAMTATAPESVTLAERIQHLAEEKTKGSIKDLAYLLGLNATYLQRLADGSQTSPSAEVIAALGLQRITHYVVRSV